MRLSVSCILSTSAVVSVSNQVQQRGRQLSMSPLGFLLRLIKIRVSANAERTGVFLVPYGVERWLKCLMTGAFYGNRAPAHSQFAGSESHIKHSSLMAEFISGWRQQTSLASVCSSPHNNPQRVVWFFFSPRCWNEIFPLRRRDVTPVEPSEVCPHITWTLHYWCRWCVNV